MYWEYVWDIKLGSITLELKTQTQLWISIKKKLKIKNKNKTPKYPKLTKNEVLRGNFDNRVSGKHQTHAPTSIVTK